MLGQHFRISLRNGAGSSGTYTVKARFFKFASDGSLEWDSTERTLMSSVSIGAAAWGNGTAFDNSASGWVGADLRVECSTSLAHQVQVQRQVSTDGGSSYPSDGYGVGVGTIVAPSAATPNAGLRML
jgi:hypothetical protein